jgi:hypothetical protein
MEIIFQGPWTVFDRRNHMARPFESKAEKDAAALRNEWSRVDKERAAKGSPRLSRKDLARQHHVTPGMISHYMRAREPLNVKWQMRFAEYMGVSPSSVWPDFPHKNLAPGQLPPDAVELTLDLLGLPPNEQGAVRSLIQSLAKKRA